ncbi:MAG: C10 family peptidase, partial [Planctomycetota bacterium]
GLGHAFVIDGVRVHKERIAVHLNCGWEGADDGWYIFDKPFKTSRGVFDNPARWILSICPEKQEESGLDRDRDTQSKTS